MSESTAEQIFLFGGFFTGNKIGVSLTLPVISSVLLNPFSNSVVGSESGFFTSKKDFESIAETSLQKCAKSIVAFATEIEFKGYDWEASLLEL